MSVKISCLLLVDDEADAVSRTAELLANTKLPVGEVVIANSLGQAITAIMAKPIDIILLDLDLGDSKSIDTLTAVRAVTDSVIVVLCMSNNELQGVESLKAGADDFIMKDAICEDCLRQTIVKSITMHNIRKTAVKIGDKIDKLTQLVGGI